MNKLLNNLKSLQMRSIQKIVETISPKNTNILIAGEKGAEKELIGKLIHNLSPRSSHSFLSINCSILTESQGNELFGDQDGLIKLTNDASMKNEKVEIGTLFLDEISKLSIPLQVKLLLFLQKKIQLQTKTKFSSTNFCIISATDIDLEKEVEKENFREDLFYKLNVIKLDIPPLRKRSEDIPILIDYYLKKYNQNSNFTTKQKYIDDKAVEVLQYHSWPGNERELENIIERVFLLSMNENISVEDIPESIRECSDVPLNLGEIPEGLSLPETLLAVEKMMIHEAMKRSGNVQIKAARFLGIGKSGLSQKLKKHRLEYFY